jgi:hypothetical protein
MKLCNCQKELKLICRKKVPLYYIFKHVHAEVEVEVYECVGCGLRVADVPRQVFRETEDERKTYEEVLHDVSIL